MRWFEQLPLSRTAEQRMRVLPVLSRADNALGPASAGKKWNSADSHAEPFPGHRRSAQKASFLRCFGAIITCLARCLKLGSSAFHFRAPSPAACADRTTSIGVRLPQSKRECNRLRSRALPSEYAQPRSKIRVHGPEPCSSSPGLNPLQDSAAAGNAAWRGTTINICLGFY
jgi:hypothetical protein